MIDFMDDEDMKQSVIRQMMDELDGVTSDSLKKMPEEPKGPVKGVEISISVSPKSEDEIPDEVKDAVGMSEGGEVACPVCDEFDCGNPDHKQDDSFGDLPAAKDQNYIQDLLKSLNDDRR